MIPNVYRVKDLAIEFVKDFKTDNKHQVNVFNDYGPLLDTSDNYLPTEFSRRDPVTYIKIKGEDLWLYEKDQQLYFDRIESDLFYKYRQPYVLWLNYLGENTFILYKQLGYGLNNVMGHIYNRNSNVIYVNYTQHNGRISMRWTTDIRFATRFVYDFITWDQFDWYGIRRAPTMGAWAPISAYHS